MYITNVIFVKVHEQWHKIMEVVKEMDQKKVSCEKTIFSNPND